jgi:soluble lytic murein transglycosylase
VGRTLARQQHVRHYSTNLLLAPNINLQLGTRYFRELLDLYNGDVACALAAYNAGSNRVQDWISNGNFKDSPEFVESIPFTETREYVQAIVRNAVVYRQLYGTP